jgi:hypothetical protein
VKVHGLIHTRGADGRFTLSKGFYRKLWRSPDRVRGELVGLGLEVAHHEVARGLVTTVARR